MSTSDFQSSVVIITGAAGDIGFACARAFAERGAAHLALVDLHPPQEPLPFITDGRAAFFAADISREADVVRVFDQTIRRFGRLDVLLNNAAALMPTRPVDQTTSEELDRILSVNVRGTFLCCKHAYPHLRQTRGNIVNISSMAGIHGEKSHAAYAASKGAINALTCSIAADWGADGIRCNAVCPSTVRTANSDLAIAQSEHAEQIHKLRRQISSLGAVAAPEQVATVVAFLASPQAGYVTGALIPVSGGSECGYGIKY